MDKTTKPVPAPVEEAMKKGEPQRYAIATQGVKSKGKAK